MLEIDIKLIPHGNRTKTEVLHRINIINDGTGSKEFGNYNAVLRTGSDGSYNGGCYIKNFPRLELNAINLLLYVLRKICRNNVRHTEDVQAAAGQ